jgi:opacity protein-like surface antigen
MKTILLAGVGAALVLAATPGFAQFRNFVTSDAGMYSRFEMGPTFRQNGDMTDFGGFPTGNGVSYDVGFAFDAVFGYAFNKWFGLEGEFGWNGNTINSVQGIQEQDTYVYEVPFLANVAFQIPLPRTKLIPYLGGGVGGSWSIFDTDLYSNGAATVVGNESDFVLAYQAFAGLRYEINEQMSAGVGYKFFATGSPTYSFEPAFGGPDFDVGFTGSRSHMILFSFVWKF